jgi:formylglycine-generating enzyme required for sulfatase activity
MTKQTLKTTILICSFFASFAGTVSAQENKIAPPKITCYIRCHVSPQERSDEIYKSAECTSCHNTVEEHNKERSIWEKLPFARIASYFKPPSDKPESERFRNAADQQNALALLRGRKPVIPPSSLKAPPGMVHIPAGEFIMGSFDRWEDEQPEYAVWVNDFFIDRYEVTNKQYKEFINATDHRPPKHWKEGDYPEGMDNYPVVYVTHFDATAYAAWAGKQLPLEEE